MHKLFKKSISLLLVFVIVISLFAIGHTDVFGSTHNVYQSRRVAEIDEFPESYRLGLQRVKDIYPNAQFVYYDTDLDWYNDVLTDENHLRLGVNLIPSSSPESWKSKNADSYDSATKTYKQIEPGWNQASQAIIEYYMDPRNFFNEKDIFQFMDLSFNGSETVESTQAILKGSFMENQTIKDNEGNDISYAQALFEAGKITGVSPYLLACRIRQEQGAGTSALISGTYSKVPGYYNYFNVGAYGSTTEKIITNGLNTAKDRGWNTPLKSIVGGAEVLASNYVGVGKNCLYLQHFNMTAVNGTVDYRVYMANTMAPQSETKMMTKSLDDKEAAYTFIIPVYDNMPTSPCELPKSDNSSDALLDSLSVNGGEIDIGKFNAYTYKYTAAIEPSQQFIILKAQLHTASASISVNGIPVDLQGGSILEKGLMISPGFNDFVITVQAPSGLCRDYQLTVYNDDGNVYYRSNNVDIGELNTVIQPNTTVEKIKQQIQTINCVIYVADVDGKIKDNDAVCVPGDMLMIMNEAQQFVYTAKIDIEGDVNRDGLVTEDDIQLIKEHLLEITTLDLGQMNIADVNNDGNVDVIDLGLIRIKTGQDIDAQNNDIRIYPNVQDELFGIKNIQAAITASAGTYFAEGFLIYNEGRISTIDEENSGRIHFIADSNHIMFDNNTDILNLNPLINSGDISFGIVINQSYDYIKNTSAKITTEQRTLSIKNTDIDVNVVFNENATENNINFHIATITIKNMMKKSSGNITVDFGQYMLSEDKKSTLDLTGLTPGDSHVIKVYLTDNMKSDVYNNLIKISYTNSKADEKMIQIGAEFEVLAHDHNGDWLYNDSKHYQECDMCSNAPNEAHTYYKKSKGVYVCSVCGYEKTFTMTISTNSAKINAAAVFEPTITANGAKVDNSEFAFEWYIDGTLASNEAYLANIFRSVGKRHIQCIARNSDGFIVVGDLDFAPQPTKQTISIISTSCTSIMIDREDGYEYKIGNGKWQKSAIFNNLQAGQEYTIYKRKVGSATTESFKIYLSHQFGKSSIDTVCGQESVVSNKCAQCSKMVYATLKDSKQSHVFRDYFVDTEATCMNGSVEVAKCVYGCGTTDSKTLNNTQEHLFEHYISDGNGNCTNGGTETAVCTYGCGTTDTRIVNSANNGHVYKYVYNNDATGEHSGTETGTCTKCGAQNIRTVDGTRLSYLTSIQLTITNNNKYGELPTIALVSEGQTIEDIVWFDANNQIADFSNGPQLGATYKLAMLKIVPGSKYIFHETIKVYINGKLFTGTVNFVDNTIELKDVCQIKF